MKLQLLCTGMRHITAYEFREVADPLEMKQRLIAKAGELGIIGLVILAHEGINFSAAGEGLAVDAFKKFLVEELGFSGLYFQETPCEKRPFKRFSVKIRAEICTFKAPVSNNRAPYIQAQELKAKLDQQSDIVLLDCRKRMEHKRGSFETAQGLDMIYFREFAELAKKFPEEWKSKEVVTFCTGGIRCEKAATYLKDLGYEKVYQLEGGIIRYFKETGGAHWRGDCFVFDDREVLKPAREAYRFKILFATLKLLRESNQ